MISIVGFLIVVGAVMGGFLMAGGRVVVLVQPSEFVVICGAAAGSVLIANGPEVIKATLSQIASIAKPGPAKKDYLDLLVMSFELLSVARRDGVMALEGHIEHPEESNIISKYPSFTKNHHAVNFLTDTMRLMISGSDIAPHDLDAMLEADMETQHHDHGKPSRVLQVVGDALPGLGIVAAVLGIVITMGHIDGPPEEIGHHVGAALVGTFLGVLLSYGFVQPMAANLANKADEAQIYYRALKQVLLAFHKGSLATTAVEFARRSLPMHVRPEFAELEEACRSARAGLANAA